MTGQSQEWRKERKEKPFLDKEKSTCIGPAWKGGILEYLEDCRQI